MRLNSIKIAVATLLMFATSVSAFAEGDDFNIWGSVEVDKSITKKWGVSAELEYRTNDHVSTTDRWSIGIGTDYKILSWLKADVGYSYLHSRIATSTTKKGNIIPAYWQPRHRAYVSLTGSVKFNRVKILLRERWQFTHRTSQSVPKYDSDGVTPKDDEVIESKNKNVLRSRLQVEYDIPNCKLSPYASFELYNSDVIEKERYTVGCEYGINKKNKVKLYYLYQNKADDDEPNGSVIGVGYTFKF